MFQMRDKRRAHRLLRECAAYLRGLLRRLLRSQRARHEGAVAAQGSRRMNDEVTGAALVAAMQASPYREVEIEPRRWRMPVRDLTL